MLAESHWLIITAFSSSSIISSIIISIIISSSIISSIISICTD